MSWTEDLSQAATELYDTASQAVSEVFEDTSQVVSDAATATTTAVSSAWEETRLAWEEQQRSMSAAWRESYAAALDTFGEEVQANPENHQAQVEAFATELVTIDAALQRMKPQLPQPATSPEDVALVQRYQALDQRYHELAAGFYADAAPADRLQLGFLPVLLAAAPYVGTLAVGLAAACWALPAYEYAVNLREQTDLAEQELNARVEASKEGRTLQPTTLPPAPPDPVAGVSKILIGGLALGAAVLLIPVFIKR